MNVNVENLVFLAEQAQIYLGRYEELNPAEAVSLACEDCPELENLVFSLLEGGRLSAIRSNLETDMGDVVSDYNPPF